MRYNPSMASRLWHAIGRFSSPALATMGALVASLTCPHMLAQGAQSKGIDYPLVEIFLTARDKKGQPTTDLRAEDLRVVQDKSPLVIESLRPAKGSPLTVGFILDMSGSRRHQFPGTELDGVLLLLNWLAREGAKGFVVGFNEVIWVQGGFDAHPAHFCIAARELLSRPVRGSSAFYDAIVASSERGLYGRAGLRVLVAVSDGDDNASAGGPRPALERTKKALREHQILLYILEVRGDLPPKRALRRAHQSNAELTEVTGGRVLSIEDRNEFESAFEDVRRDLEGLYVLSFHPSASSGSKHRIKVETMRKDVKLSAPKEYSLASR